MSDHDDYELDVLYRAYKSLGDLIAGEVARRVARGADPFLTTANMHARYEAHEAQRKKENRK
jgi:hypothetical protein